MSVREKTAVLRCGVLLGALRRALHSAVLSALLGATLGSCGGPTGTPATAPRTVETLPAERGGQDLVGQAFPALVFEAWIAADGEAAPVESAPEAAAVAAGSAGDDAARAPVTLYRWWTDTCPYCASSLPALESMRRAYAGRGLRIVAVYHPKPPRPAQPGEVRDAARALGYSGLLAVDEDWSELERLYLSTAASAAVPAAVPAAAPTGAREATSASFLVDADGVIRFVHPGPEFHPSDDPREALQDADYRSLVRAVEVLLD
jgi:thiol-disulfide isomerase/thioredoxin